MHVVRNVALQRLAYILRGLPQSRVAIALNQIAPSVDPNRLTYQQAANILGARGIASIIGTNTAEVMRAVGSEACCVGDLIEPAPVRARRNMGCACPGGNMGRWGYMMGWTDDLGTTPVPAGSYPSYSYGGMDEESTENLDDDYNTMTDDTSTYGSAYEAGGGEGDPSADDGNGNLTDWVNQAFPAGGWFPDGSGGGGGTPEQPADDGNLTDWVNQAFPPGGWFPGQDPSLPGLPGSGGGGGPTPAPGTSGGGGRAPSGGTGGNVITRNKGLVLAGLAVAGIGLVAYYG